MDEVKAEKILRKNSLSYDEAEAEEFCAAYDFALKNLADMYQIKTICNGYLMNKYTAKEAMLQITKLVKNGERT